MILAEKFPMISKTKLFLPNPKPILYLSKIYQIFQSCPRHNKEQFLWRKLFLVLPRFYIIKATTVLNLKLLKLIFIVNRNYNSHNSLCVHAKFMNLMSLERSNSLLQLSFVSHFHLNWSTTRIFSIFTFTLTLSENSLSL